MKDGKGALRKGWQYIGDKMGETRKEEGFIWGQCRRDNTESEREWEQEGINNTKDILNSNKNHIISYLPKLHIIHINVYMHTIRSTYTHIPTY